MSYDTESNCNLFHSTSLRDSEIRISTCAHVDTWMNAIKLISSHSVRRVAVKPSQRLHSHCALPREVSYPSFISPHQSPPLRFRYADYPPGRLPRALVSGQHIRWRLGTVTTSRGASCFTRFVCAGVTCVGERVIWRNIFVLRHCATGGVMVTSAVGKSTQR